MGELTEKLKALTVRVTSPDGRIDGVLHSWEQAVEIAFRDGDQVEAPGGEYAPEPIDKN